MVKYFSNAWGASKADFTLRHTDGQCTLVIAHGQKEAEIFLNELSLFNTGKKIMYFPEYTHGAFEEIRVLPEISAARSMVMANIHKSKDKVILVTTPYAILKKIPPESIFNKNIIILKQNQEYERDKLLKNLDKLGYLPVEVVTGAGEFCVRGGIVDLFPATFENPVRIEYFDNEIDYIYEYNVYTQQKIANLNNITLLPISEILMDSTELVKTPLPAYIREKIENFGKYAGHQWLVPLIYSDSQTILDYLPDDTSVISLEEEWENLFEKSFLSIKDNSADTNFENPMDAFATVNDIKSYINAKSLIAVSDVVSKEDAISTRYRSIKSRFSFEKGNFYYSLTQTLNEVTRLHSEGYKTVIAMESERFIKLLEDFCKDHEIDLKEIVNIKEAKELKLYLYKQRLSGGFINEKDKIVFITDEEIFGFIRKKQKSSRKESFNTSITDLEDGDFVVHLDYGIGIYRGLKHMEMGGIKGDYLDILYDNNEILYVPLEQISQIQKYIGVGDSKPRLANLQSTNWNKLKASARKQAAKIAQDLLKLYAERKARKGYAFKDDGELVARFEEMFEYDETEDQLTAIMDVYKDMASKTPMERLVCGDVGFGKTEVAMRAAFKAVVSGKQVAVLVPTTVLARQHFNTFIKRFKDFSVNIDYVSRMRSNKEIAEIKHKLQSGDIDIIIGTHKLLGNDIQFKDLRLLIIDEEQRFGVAHKEKIAAMRTNIDVLALSATPIPRTLQLSLSGMREISIIETPPFNRTPVSVSVIQHGDDVRKAMMKELDRNGQIFFLHNRVNDLGSVADYVKNLVPQAKIASAHGQTPPKQLEKILTDFYNGEIDILVSTTIIENGIDIPNVNAIFIDKAANFGLSQLYQLKGRVGRSAQRGYCYLLVDNMSSLTPIAKKRLSIIQQLSDLGSGLKIAMYDLQLRGAGDILGAAQSGFATKVGFELFIKMIAEAVAELQQTGIATVETEIITQFPYYIAADYIEDPRIRLDYYKMFSELNDKFEMENMLGEMRKQYGDVKQETINLGYIMLIKKLCSALKIKKAGIYPKMLRLTFSMNSNISVQRLTDIAISKKYVFRFAGEFEFVLAFTDESSTLQNAANFLALLKTEN